MDLPKCVQCGREMVSQLQWSRAGKEGRAVLSAEGKVGKKTADACSPCYTRGLAKPAPPKATGPLTGRECAGCAKPMVRKNVWRDASPEQRAKWRARGWIDINSRDRCPPCYRRLTLEAMREQNAAELAEQIARAAEIAALRAEGLTIREAGERLGMSYSAAQRLASVTTQPPESPHVLTSGRWVLCPVRRVKVWREAA